MHQDRHPPAKSPLVPDSAWILRSRSQVESTLGGFTADARPGSEGLRLGPCLTPPPTSPSSPLTASTAPSDICRCVFTTSKGRVRVAATWSGEERAQLHSQALRGTKASQGRLRKPSRLPGRHCYVETFWVCLLTLTQSPIGHFWWPYPNAVNSPFLRRHQTQS